MLGSRGSGDRIKHQFMITVTQEDNDHSGEAQNDTHDITRDSDETHINDKQINTISWHVRYDGHAESIDS